jgi:hypothetical protein
MERKFKIRTLSENINRKIFGLTISKSIILNGWEDVYVTQTVSGNAIILTSGCAPYKEKSALEIFKEKVGELNR